MIHGVIGAPSAGTARFTHAWAEKSGGGVEVEVVVTPVGPISTPMVAPLHSIERLVPPSTEPPTAQERTVDIGPKFPGTKIGVTGIGTNSEAKALVAANEISSAARVAILGMVYSARMALMGTGIGTENGRRRDGAAH
jgi:hypothetical protein